MSLLTITKLTDSVGAEVAGLEPAALANDDSVGATVLDALEDNGVLVFRGLAARPAKPRSRSAGASARSITPPTATTRCRAFTQSP